MNIKHLSKTILHSAFTTVLTLTFFSTPIFAAGDTIRTIGDNLMICTAASCALNAPPDFGNITIESALGLGTQPSVNLDILTPSIETGFQITGSLPNTRFRLKNTGANGRAFDTIVTNNSSVFGGGSYVISDKSVNLSTDLARLIINSAGVVSIGTITSDAPLTVDGSITSLFAGDALRTYRNVANYSSNTTTINGTIKIVMPNDWTSTMMTIKITGYDFTAATGPWEIVIGGYNYSTTPGWYNYTATAMGRIPFTTVRLARDTVLGKNVILLGTTSTVWAYPKLTVSEITVGHSNYTGWGTGWDIFPDSSDSNLANISSVPIDLYTNTTGNYINTGNTNLTGGITTPQFYNTAGGYNYSNTWLAFNGYYGSRWSSGHLFTPNSTTVHLIESGAANNTGLSMANNAGTIYGYLYGDASGVGILDTSRHWQVLTTLPGSYMYSPALVSGNIQTAYTKHGRWEATLAQVGNGAYYNWDSEEENYGGFTRSAYGGQTYGQIALPEAGTYLININVMCKTGDGRVDWHIYASSGTTPAPGTQLFNGICAANASGLYSTHGASLVVQFDSGGALAVDCTVISGTGYCWGAGGEYTKLDITKLN